MFFIPKDNLYLCRKRITHAIAILSIMKPIKSYKYAKDRQNQILVH